jgi:5-methylcytosine-specific restriction endonuclease McrA
MGRYKKYSLETAKALFGLHNLELLAVKYEDTSKPLKYRCKVCGYVGTKTLNNLMKGKKCPKCANKERAKNRKISFDVVIRAFWQRGYKLLSSESEYYNAHTKLRYMCHCGYETYISYTDLVHGEKGCKRCADKKKAGINHPLNNPNISKDDYENQRKSPEYRRWRTAVLKRDDYTCVSCGLKRKIKYIHVHHLFSYADYEDKRLDINNGVTMCKDCHDEFHREYGYGHNTAFQFKEFLNKKMVA